MVNLPYSLTVSTAAASRPVTVAECKRDLRIADDVADHDSLISDLIDAAIVKVERDARRVLVTRTLQMNLDCFPEENYIEIVRGPLASVTSIAYTDGNGDSQTWSSSNYIVDTAREPGLIKLAYNATWPTTRGWYDDVTITYVAGQAVTAVPADAKAALRILVTHWFENPEAVLVGSASKELELNYRALVNGLHPGNYP